MRRLAFVLALVFPVVHGGVCDEWAATDTPRSTSTYVRRHMVQEVADGLTQVTDQVRVWPVSSELLCFYAEATFTNLHFCQLHGEARRVSPNTYRYRDNQCHVELTMKKGALIMNVKSPVTAATRECHPLFHGEDICGANTAIPSGTFEKVR
jgi:hypothetical protein